MTVVLARFPRHPPLASPAILALSPRRSRFLPLSSPGLFPRHSRSFPPVILAKAGIHRVRAGTVGTPAMLLSEIRIYGIIGFSGFYRLVFGSANTHPHSAWRDLRLWRKAQCGRQRNPENPANPVNPDSDKSARSSVNRNSVIPLKRLTGVGLRPISPTPEPRLRAARPHPSLLP